MCHCQPPLGSCSSEWGPLVSQLYPVLQHKVWWGAADPRDSSLMNPSEKPNSSPCTRHQHSRGQTRKKIDLSPAPLTSIPTGKSFLRPVSESQLQRANYFHLKNIWFCLRWTFWKSFQWDHYCFPNGSSLATNQVIQSKHTKEPEPLMFAEI